MFMHRLKIMMILIKIYFVNLFVLGQNFGQSTEKLHLSCMNHYYLCQNHLELYQMREKKYI